MTIILRPDGHDWVQEDISQVQYYQCSQQTMWVSGSMHTLLILLHFTPGHHGRVLYSHTLLDIRLRSCGVRSIK